MRSASTGSVRLTRLTELVVNQVSHWSEARWGPLGDTLHHVVQRIAGSDHPVPRLGAMALPDQLRVVVSDVLREGDEARIDAALDELTGFRGNLIASQ